MKKLKLILAYYTPEDASVLGNIDIKTRKLLETTEYLIKAMNNIIFFDNIIGQKFEPMQRPTFQ